ncbi:hypothetical protein HK097_009198 [Rhizophlyctis rosea]|uniref:Uncharacterized protein n=1 Tax=Rhizophlyctis rosea TaxID=64517 RepID=A0AAD5X0L3_9FUNG|nr:hypothetical protein HK097_009198 [Rhizophlyctis rosea]
MTQRSSSTIDPAIISSAVAYSSDPASVGIINAPGRVDAAPVPNNSPLANPYANEEYPGVIRGASKLHGTMQKGLGKVEEKLGKAFKDADMEYAGVVHQEQGQGELDYARVEKEWRKEEKRIEKELTKVAKERVEPH